MDITQSLIKGFEDVNLGEMCGHYFDHFYIKHPYTSKPTESMILGRLFEYVAHNGGDELPEYTPKTKGGKPTTAAQRAVEQGLQFRDDLQRLGLKVVLESVRISSDLKPFQIEAYSQFMDKERLEYAIEYGIGGELDFVCEIDHKQMEKSNPSLADNLKENRYIIIDTKFSGLLDDKWHPFGWNPDRLPFNDKITIQSKHYQHITGLPFMWAVYETTAAARSRWILATNDKAEMQMHENRIEEVRAGLAFEIKKGFKASPEWNRCNKCELSDKCEFRATAPTIEVCYIGQSI